MSIVTFWSDTKDKTSQTTSIIASALQMGIDRNLKILIVDATYTNSNLIEAFEETGRKNIFAKKTNMGQIGVSEGMEGLLKAVSSNKVAPEIVNTYSASIFTERLDALYAMKYVSIDEFEASLGKIYEMLKIADQYYDLIFVDLEKGSRTEGITRILNDSTLIIYTMEQKIKQINKFTEIWGKDELLINKTKVIPLLTKEDSFSKYNCDNVARKIGMRPGMPSIIYNTLLMEAVQEAGAVQFMLMINDNDASYRNNYLIKTIQDLNMLIIERIQQLRY